MQSRSSAAPCPPRPWCPANKRPPVLQGPPRSGPPPHGARRTKGLPFFRGDLDPGHRPMVPDPDLPESPGEQIFLRRLDHPQFRRRNLPAAGDAGGQTGGRRLVPDGHPFGRQDETDLVFRETQLPQGGKDAQFGQGPHPRASPRRVIGVRPLQEAGDTVGRRHLFPQFPEKLPLAEIAALPVILQDAPIGKTVFPDNDVLQTGHGGEPHRRLQFPPGIEAGIDSHGHRLAGTTLARGNQEQQTVHPAGKGDGSPAQPQQTLLQLPVFVPNLCRFHRCLSSPSPLKKPKGENNNHPLSKL